MAKSNPLFVDSTKFHGDLIVCQIELKDVLIYDGERLSVIVTSQDGVVRKMDMAPLDERGYEGRVHLNHQSSFSFQFVIEKDGQRLFQSIIHKARARYSVSERWQPVLEDPAQYDPVAVEPISSEDSLAAVESLPSEAVAMTSTVPTVTAKDRASWARESSLNVRSLIDKWGL